MGVVIGAALGGILSVALALFLGVKYFKPGQRCVPQACLDAQVVSEQNPCLFSSSDLDLNMHVYL
jgi:hypothetical protein